MPSTGVYLQRSRHGTNFYFRRRVPDDLRPLIAQRQLYRTLDTADLLAAIVRARALAAQTDQLFAALRDMSKKMTFEDYLARYPDWGSWGGPSEEKKPPAKPACEPPSEPRPEFNEVDRLPDQEHEGSPMDAKDGPSTGPTLNYELTFKLNGFDHLNRPLFEVTTEPGDEQDRAAAQELVKTVMERSAAVERAASPIAQPEPAPTLGCV